MKRSSHTSVVTVLLTATTILGLLTMAFPPRRTWHGAHALLVTQSAALAGAEPIAAGTIQPNALVLTLPGAVGDQASSARHQELATIEHLRVTHPDLHRLDIVGDGLEPWELEQWPGVVTSFAPAATQPGVIAIDWNRQLQLGDALEITGRTVSNQPLHLALSGPAGIDDRIDLEPGVQSFRLRAIPRAPGRVRYRLELDPEGSEGAQPDDRWIDVDVTPGRALSLLWLEDAPSFESRAVLAWLRQTGIPFALRSRWSRERHRTEFGPAADAPQLAAPDRISESTLRRFAVVISDDASLTRLDDDERRAIAARIRSGDLGLLLRRADPDGPRPSSVGGDALPTLPWRAIDDLPELLSTVHWPGATTPGGTTPAAARPAPLRLPARTLTPTPTLLPLVVDQAERILAGREPYGRGAVARSLLDATHPWVLAGNGAAHAALWQHLIEAVAPVGDGLAIHLPRGPIRVDEPLTMGLNAACPAPVLLTTPDGGSSPLALATDPVELDRAWATYHPRQQGWHRLECGQRSAWFHPSGRPAWAVAAAERRRQATTLRAVQDHARRVPASSWQLQGHWPRGLGYSMFLAALTALWWRRRQHRNAGPWEEGERT